MLRFQRRLGVDLDSENQLELLKTVFNSFQFGYPRVFKTRHGYHVEVSRFDGEPWTLQQSLEVRRSLGDDPLRLAYDEMKVYAGLQELVDTLFHGKRGRDGVRYTRGEPLDWFTVVSRGFWGECLPAGKRGR